MKKNKSINPTIVGTNTRNKSISVIGLALFGLLLMVVFAEFNIKTAHLSKIKSLAQIKLDLTSAHLEFEDIVGKAFFKNNQPSAILKAKSQLEYLLNPPDWFDKILPLYSQKQEAELQNILKQISYFETLCVPDKYITNKLQHDAVFNTLITRITNLQGTLNQTMLSQSRLLTRFGWALLVLLLLYLFYIIYSRKLSAAFLNEQQQLLQTLKKQNYFLEASQNLSHLGYYTYDFSTKKFDASKYLTDLMGLNSGVGNLQSWIDIIHPEDRFILDEALKQRLIDETSTLDVTYRVIKPSDGKVFWMHHTAQILQKDEKGNIMPILGVLQDITESKLFELSLIESEALLNKVQSIAKLGSLDYNILTQKGTFSKECAQITGFTNRHEITFDEWLTLVHPDDRENNQKAFELSRNEGVKYNREYRIYSKGTNELKWIHGEGEIFFKDGIATNFIGTIQDITRPKLIELDLIDNQKKLLEAQEITRLGSFKFNDQTDFFETSILCDEILGIDSAYKKDILGWINLAHPDDYLEAQSLLDDDKIATISKEIRIIRPCDHQLIWILAYVKKEFDSKGKRLRINGTIQDITQRKLIEEKLRQSDIILNKLSTIVLVVNDVGDITYASPSIKESLGFEPSDMLGQGWWQLTFENLTLANTIKEAVLGYFFNNKELLIDISLRRLITKSGEAKWFEWHVSKGVGNTYLSMGIDVTEREREAQIKEVIYNITKKASSSLNLEKLFIFIKLELNKLINTNNFFIALYDKTRDMISTPFMADEEDEGFDFPKGKTLTGYIIDTKKSLLATDIELLNLKNNQKVEIIGPLSKCWLGVPLMVGKEAIGAIVIQSYNDANAYSQKDAELLELVASNIGQVIKQTRNFEKISLLNQAVFQSPESVVVTNAEGEIEFANPAFTKLSGYTIKESLGKMPRIMKSGEQNIELYNSLWQTIKGGKTWEGELINKRKDGLNYLVKVNISPVKNKVGDITHFVLVEEDITEKRKLERDFIHAFIDAQEQEKQSFGEDLHDGISQILAAESMYVEVLRKLNTSNDKRVIEALDKIKSLNLSAINDARGIAHGLMSKQLKESGLIKAVSHICEDYNQSKKIVFNFKNSGLIEEEISKEIKINIFRITQEISTNIIRHSGAKNTEISLTKTNQNQLQLIVKDDGVGMDLEKMERENKGAGLKNIERRITLLNGNLKLDTAPDQGTCYTIIVPL